MEKIISRILFVLMFIPLLYCGRNVIFTESDAMPAKQWELKNVQVFEVPVTDTLSDNNIFFTIRTGTSYPFRNIYLFVTTTSPDGRSITDTLQYNLADENGNWFGKGFGDIHELNLPFKTNVFFPIKGTYKIKVQHGMRQQDLKGVYDFGIRIVRSAK